MKKKLLLMSLLIFVVSTTLFAKNNIGKELFLKKCGICHKLTFPKNKADMVAPPAPGVMFHMHRRFKSDKEILAYMRNFVINPTKKTSLKKETKRFGLMPSQKGIVTQEELNKITKWMVENIHLSPKQHKMIEAKYKHKNK